MSGNGNQTRAPSEQDLANATPQTRAQREFRVGIFVLVGIISVLVSLFLLTDPATFRGRYMLLTNVEDAGGIRRGDPIQMRGVNIGRVHRFVIGEQGVEITLEIEGEWQGNIPEDSRIQLKSAGIMGGLIADVIPGRSTFMAEPWSTLEGSSGMSILESTDQLGNQATNIMEQIETLLDEPTVSGVQTSVQSLNAVLEELSAMTQSQAARIDDLTTTLNRTATSLEENLDEAGPNAAATLEDARRTMEELRATSEALRTSVASLEVVLGRLERGEGTLGLLSTDEELYRNLTAASGTLNELLVDFQANPSKYVNLSIF
jgi:phospholipid/cholesterol/gamma-HCH transport system substrate-binding protein